VRPRGARSAPAEARPHRPRRLIVSAAAALALAVPALALPAAAGALPDGRQYELVTPPNKHGSEIDAPGEGVGGLLGGLEQTSEEGNAFTFVADAPFESEPEGNRSLEGTQGISFRTPSGWKSKDIVTPVKNGEGAAAGNPQEYRFFSADLSSAVLVPFGNLTSPFQEPPLVPGVEKEERGIYMRHNATCEGEPATCFQPLVNGENDGGHVKGKPAPFGAVLVPVGASPDLKHVVFTAPVPLTATASGHGGLYEWNAGAPASEQLQYVSVLPGEKEINAPESGLGDDVGEEDHSARNAVSANGERVFWQDLRGEHQSHLYMRDTVKHATIQLNAAQEGVKETPPTKNVVRYELANPEGNRVFFTDTAPLNLESHQKRQENVTEAGETLPDLYVCEIAEGAEGPKCKLKDLSVAPNPEESARIIGAVMGSGEEEEAGTATVYFVADGVLAPGAVPGTCSREIVRIQAEPEAKCNLYVEKFEGGEWHAPMLVAVISNEDASDWSVSGKGTLRLTARVSPNGRYLAFVSTQQLTGYDNHDANSGKRDTEVFLYDSSSNTMSCPSCNANPEHRPTGVFDSTSESEPLGLVIDPASVLYPNHWVAGALPGYTPTYPAEAPYQSRYLLNDGRLYFNSTDALVPEDTNQRTETVGESKITVGVTDVYQFEPNETGSCHAEQGCVSLISSGNSPQESAFIDASTTGNNVFFLTSQALTGTDIDEAADAYDARECTEASPCIKAPPPPPPPCSGEEGCRPGGAHPPGFGGTPSETSSLAGNGKGTIEVSKFVERVKPTKTPLQILKTALAKCHSRFKHNKHNRAACEKRARHAYKVAVKKAQVKR
jgi:hypothetical protein